MKRKEIPSHYYDLVYKQTIMKNILLDPIKDRLQYIAKNIKGNSVLDVGCGLGLLADYIGTYKTYMGVDFSQFAIYYATKNVKNKKACYTCADINSWDTCAWLQRGDNFDTVVLSDVLENSVVPEKILKRYSRFANKQVVITLPFHDDDINCLHPDWNGKAVRKLVTQAGKILKLTRFGGDNNDSWWLIIIEPWSANGKKK